MGDIGRAEAIDHFGSKSRAVVANRDADLLARPSGGDLNAAVGEIHRVFDQIAEPITDCRIALAARFAGAVGRVSDDDRNPEITVWRHRLFDQCRERRAVEGLACRQFGDLRQYLAAALGLFAQQFDILGIGRAGLERPFDLADHHGDGREWRAELVRGGGGQAVELGQMLLARQHQFGRGERIGELARFLGDLPRVNADIADGEQDREPDADHVDFGELKRVLGIPR